MYGGELTIFVFSSSCRRCSKLRVIEVGARSIVRFVFSLCCKIADGITGRLFFKRTKNFVVVVILSSIADDILSGKKVALPGA